MAGATNEPRKPTEKDAYFFLTILNSMKVVPDVSCDPLLSFNVSSSVSKDRHQFNVHFIFTNYNLLSLG